jgi:1-acyl-sn-glycerol-3-phosphate acyltransferase
VPEGNRPSLLRTALLGLIGGPATIAFSLVSLVGGLLHAPRGLHDWVHRTWSRFLLALAGIHVRVEGLENIRPGAAQVVVANHQSLFDILALFAVLPVSLRYIAKIELSRIPVFGGAMRQAGHVFIDRSDLRQAIRAMRAAGARMREDGLTLGVFPEGTRSRDGRLQPFRKGSFVLAIETGTRLVPVAIQGGRAILPKGRRLLHPGPMRVCCAPAIELDRLEREDRDSLLAETRDRIAGMLAP